MMSNILLLLIIACEAGFWVMLFLGLYVRYWMNRPRLSGAILSCVPVLDGVLLLATAVDLARGSPPEFAHGLAAVYLGVTVVYGPGIIRWFDRLIAGKGTATPQEPAPAGWAYALLEWRRWFQGVAAGGIAAGLLLAAIVTIDQPQQSQPLVEWLKSIGWVLLLWLVFWPLWYTVFPKKRQQANP